MNMNKSISQLFPSLKLIILLVAAIFGLIFFISVSNRNKEKLVQNIVPFPSLSNVKEISIDASNRNKFVRNLLGSEYLNYSSTTKFYSTVKVGNEAILDINSQLVENKWQLETDWGHRDALILSNWKKGDFELTVLVFDDLDSFGISGLDKNYGIRGLTPGQTLFVIYATDKFAPLS